MPMEVKQLTLENGEILAYRERTGEEPCMLLIHGNLASSELWEPFMEQFASASRLIAIDLRGYGYCLFFFPLS
ncbi:alpha/beta fold hydrolase [Brevibacillus marinus]|uniref:alpha/beta fold hydrolase n=1 Tax=Brevibacillus marinus TaxID=2496837 RepID=UPI000F8447DF|nr:alpha/beta fold hydrolase [Brevibacillus marinus]